jgi:hypothetical protein
MELFRTQSKGVVPARRPSAPVWAGTRFRDRSTEKANLPTSILSGRNKEHASKAFRAFPWVPPPENSLPKNEMGNWGVREGLSRLFPLQTFFFQAFGRSSHRQKSGEQKESPLPAFLRVNFFPRGAGKGLLAFEIFIFLGHKMAIAFVPADI